MQANLFGTNLFEGLYMYSYLEQYAIVWDVSPEVGDRVPDVSPAHLDLQDPVAVQIRANLTLNIIES